MFLQSCQKSLGIALLLQKAADLWVRAVNLVADHSMHRKPFFSVFREAGKRLLFFYSSRESRSFRVDTTGSIRSDGREA